MDLRIPRLCEILMEVARDYPVHRFLTVALLVSFIMVAVLTIWYPAIAGPIAIGQVVLMVFYVVCYRPVLQEIKLRFVQETVRQILAATKCYAYIKGHMYHSHCIWGESSYES